MNDEEIKAIELLTKRMENLKEYECLYQWKDEIKVLLNLIEKQKAEIGTLKRDFEIVDHECSRLEKEDIRKDEQIEQYINMLATNDMLHVLECEKKDKIIDLMAEYIYDRNAEGAICSELWKKDCEPCIPCIKEYFENKVKESK